MRIHFQAVPWDLYLATVYTVGMSGALLAAGITSPLGLLLVGFAPGYLLLATLLPQKGQADAVLRIVLSVGLSFALAAFAGIVLDFTPWGITFVSVLVSLLVLSVALAALAYRARMRVPQHQRLEVSITLEHARWVEYSISEKMLAIALVIVLAAAVPFAGWALLQPRATQTFTELYLLGPSGNFTGYPSRLNVSEPGTLDVVVADHEAAKVDYMLRVDLVGVRIAFNATSRQNETIELNRTSWSWYNFTLADGQTWTRAYTFEIPAAGTWQVQFLLFRDGDLATVYEAVNLLVVIT